MVRLTPRAALDRIDGWTLGADGRPMLQARTTAAPTDGRANAALEKLVARAVGLPPSAVRVISGASSRIKTLLLDGADEAEVRRKLGAPAP